LHALSPLAVLARGYALVHHERRVIRSVEEIAPGQKIGVRMNDGTLRCEVQAVRRKPIGETTADAAAQEGIQ
jgi:exodeoxyribonuclease VII large subunit